MVLDFAVRSLTPLICGMLGLVVLFLAGASLQDADLRGAYLRLARLDGADLSDANLEGADGLTQAQLDRAHLNVGTKLPKGLTGVEDAK